MTGSEYVPVEANAVMPMVEGGSSGDSGFAVTGFYINWTREGGIINRGWEHMINASGGPFDGMTVAEIEEMIDNKGNLNELFSAWQATPVNKAGYLSALAAEEIYGQYYPNDPSGQYKNGCIGEQMFF